MSLSFADAARLVFLNELAESLAEVKYPSSDLLDRIETSLRTTDEAMHYLGLLLDKRGGKYPSMQLLDRAQRVVAAIEQAELRASQDDSG